MVRAVRIAAALTPDLTGSMASLISIGPPSACPGRT